MSVTGTRARATVQIRVRLFAMLRERTGASTLDLELEPGATVADAMRMLARRDGLADLIARLPLRTAVNREYAEGATPLSPGDELALIPPLSGGAQLAERVHVRLSSDPLFADVVRAAVADPRAGAIVVFEGVTREVAELEYEAYAEMAHERIEQIAHDCVRAHRAWALAIEHRIGAVPLGEPGVIVAASAAHRPAAFAAAKDAIDRLKAEAPIWKREHFADGAARWVPGAPPEAPRGDRVSAPAGDGGDTRVRALTHIAADGSARMVDVSDKQPTLRSARARARVRMSARTAHAVAVGDAPKGEVLGVARIAGIQAAKQTAHLVPLAHPLTLTFVDVAARVDEREGVVTLTAEARTHAHTGVELEAITACTVAALTVYDMVKGLERGVAIEEVALLEKRGGRSDFRRED
jgi:molybdenum cofactor biosynthesis protein MoaC/molybdopterin converting factor subunit 1